MKYKSSSSCCPGGDGEHRITWQIGVIRVEVGWLSVSLSGDLQVCISKSARYIPPGAVRQIEPQTSKLQVSCEGLSVLVSYSQSTIGQSLNPWRLQRFIIHTMLVRRGLSQRVFSLPRFHTAKPYDCLAAAHVASNLTQQSRQRHFLSSSSLPV